MAEAKDLSDEEKLFFTHIIKGHDDEAVQLLRSGNVRVDCEDQHGMTPLMSAAYRGKAEMCELLIANGADVNSNNHEHQYTALMFACLAGSIETTRLLLQAGANVNAENSMGRTASQLGAFVGQNDCVSLINNFVSVEELQYYTRPQGLEKEPKLPSHLAPSLHKYAVGPNLSPVKIVLFLQNHMELLENYKCVVKVMGLLVESKIKGREMNEVLALKLHYLAFILRKCARWHEGLEGKDGIEGFIRCLTKGRPSDGFFIAMEELIRQAIKEFDYPECTLFKQLVTTIAPVEKGQDPTSLAVLTQSINGIRCGDFSECCTVCTESRDVKKCAACKMVGYCGVKCQKLHWSTHKKFCKQLAKDYEKQLALKLEEERLQEEDSETNQSDGEKAPGINGKCEGETLNCKNPDNEGIHEPAEECSTLGKNVKSELSHTQALADEKAL